MALLFLKGVRMGSPMRALAITLPENMTSMEESHRDRGCFREKVKPAVKNYLIIRYHNVFQDFGESPLLCENVEAEMPKARGILLL